MFSKNQNEFASRKYFQSVVTRAEAKRVAAHKEEYNLSEFNATIKRQRLCEEKKPMYSLPIFGIRQRRLNGESDSYYIGKEIIKDYNLALFKSTILALGCDVIEIAAKGMKSYKTCEPDYQYVRDPVVILHDKKLIISSPRNKYYGSEDIIGKIQEVTDYQSMIIENIYFEGGNVFYFPQKKILFHGLDPGGHYNTRQELYKFLTPDCSDRYQTVDPIITNQILAEKLHSFSIRVRGLRLNPEVFHYKKGDVHEDYYYHLDCFMQALPDGRVLILNKKILSDASQKLLHTVFGKKFIDLGYADYLTKPVLFNFITLPEGDKLTVICPKLPTCIVDALKKLNLKVVIPESFDARKACYDRRLAEKVTAELKLAGYEDPNSATLATHVPKNRHGYRMGDFSTRRSDWYEEATGPDNESLDKYFSKKAIRFDYGAGGPHCFTTEIRPAEQINLPLAKKKPHLLAPSPHLFYQPKKPSLTEWQNPCIGCNP